MEQKKKMLVIALSLVVVVGGLVFFSLSSTGKNPSTSMNSQPKAMQKDSNQPGKASSPESDSNASPTAEPENVPDVNTKSDAKKSLEKIDSDMSPSESDSGNLEE